MLSTGNPVNPVPPRAGHLWCLYAQSRDTSVTIAHQGSEEWLLDKVPRKEKEKCWMTISPQGCSTCLTSSLVTSLLLTFLILPSHLRHFHLCSLGPSQEYVMATWKWDCIRSLWFFESHLKSRSISSSEIRAKGNWMHLPKLCPSASESWGLIYTAISPKLLF